MTTNEGGEMKLSRRLQDEREFVERKFGDSAICDRCQATIPTFADKCTASLSEGCPGFMAIDAAKKQFALENWNRATFPLPATQEPGESA